MAAAPMVAAVPLAFYSSVFGASCWLLSRAYREDPRTLAARHSLYILLGFSAMIRPGREPGLPRRRRRP